MCLTLSICGCQYSSCCVFAVVLLILEKKVGLVRYISFGSKPNVSAITAWIRPRTALNNGKQRNCVRLQAKSKDIYHIQYFINVIELSRHINTDENEQWKHKVIFNYHFEKNVHYTITVSQLTYKAENPLL